MNLHTQPFSRTAIERVPACRGEYWWSQHQPERAAVMAAIDLPRRCSVGASYGSDARRQSLTLRFEQSATGLDHLTVTELTHRGSQDDPAITRDLTCLVFNTTVLLLRRHCQRQLSLSGQVPPNLLPGLDEPLAWERWGFQPLAAHRANSRRRPQRILARVRDLQIVRPDDFGGLFPEVIDADQLTWSALPA